MISNTRQSAKKARSSNFELLRILAMYLIVLHHACVHGALPSDVLSGGGAIVAAVLSIGGKLGVILFVMITGYFMVKSRFRVKSFLKVLLQTVFYGVVIVAAFYLLDPQDITWERAVASLQLNSSGGLPWFVVAYLGLYLFIPFLNKLAAALSRAGFRKLLIVGAACFSVVPTAFNVTFICSHFAWFAYLYLLAGYLRMYEIRFSGGKLAALIAVPLVVVAGLTALLVANPDATEALGISARYFAGEYSAFMLLAGIGVFLAFGQLRMPASKLVNGIASTTFGIYLIHDNAIVRPWLWAHFGAAFELRALLLGPALLVLALGVFAMCGVIDYIRQLLARLLAVRPAQERLAALYARVDRWFDLDE